MTFFHCAKAQGYLIPINVKACGILTVLIFMLSQINTAIDVIHGGTEQHA
ncbi:hypothetical protein HWQ46_05180 [Shewanella sp. D64]|nr:MULTISPECIES: hypothetical protein [unclassified Shewanella]MEC4724944.1 hypothetical protein [Shewanella sp. D64]MEC4736845.1 hypothetical protein [Shewanella sp. E94]WBJ96444.1 hypothetical protein HWQ47_04785 [Shewanella sp. MTB7]